jgi:hypothetical protein
LGNQDNVKAAEIRWRDTDHDVWPAGKPDGLACNRGIRAEALLPQSMTGHNNRQMFFFRREAAAEGHAQLRDIEEISSDGLSPDAFWFTGAADGGGQQIVVRCNAGERFRLFAHVFVKKPAEVIAARASGLCSV